MPKLIHQPGVIAPAGNKPKRIEEYVGRVSSGDEHVSVARMRAPAGRQPVRQGCDARCRTFIGIRYPRHR